MAHKKSSGVSRNGRESNAKYLGVKKYGGEKVRAGHIIMRQRGTRIKPGRNVGLGRDHTLFATADGYVTYEHMHGGGKRVSVYPTQEVA